MNLNQPSANKLNSQPPIQQGRGELDFVEAPQDPNFYNELLGALKQGYEERIKALEAQVKEIYSIVENDEITNTMKLNHVSDEYRRLRVQEVVEESLLSEKEAQIQRLLHNNAYLEAEISRLEDDKLRIKKVYQEEVEKFQKTVDEFEDILQNEAQDKRRIEEERQKLLKRLEELGLSEGEANQKRENQFSQSIQGYQNEISDLKQEIDNLKTKYGQAEYGSAKKEEIISDLKKEIQSLQKGYQELEGNHNGLIEEYNLLKELVDKMQEGGIYGEEEIMSLKQKLEKSENELKRTNNLLQGALLEKTELVAKSDYITNQAKQIVEKEKRDRAEAIENIQNKYNTKKSKYKKRAMELETLNQDLNRKLEHLRVELNESKSRYTNLSLEMEENMKLIKNEWERKCQEIELSSQRAMTDITAKYHNEIEQLQIEYQSVLDKKLSELQTEASSQITKSKNADLELKAQLENKVAQIEKDYISRTKHENILTNELLDLKASHIRELRSLEERIEFENSQRTKESIHRVRIEYDAELKELKDAKKQLDIQYELIKKENQKIKESLTKEKDTTSKLGGELVEFEKRLKDVKLLLEETNRNFNKFKGLYEEESKKNKSLEQERKELTFKVQVLEKKEASFDQLSSMLREEISSLSDANLSNKTKISDLEKKLGSLAEENTSLRGYIEQIEKEKEVFEGKTQELIQELNKSEERILAVIAKTCEEEGEKLALEVEQKERLQARVGEIEPKVKHLEIQLDESEEKIKEQKVGIEKLERYNNELKTTIQVLDDELRNSKNDNKELNKRLERNKHIFGEKISKIWRLCVFKIEGFRNEITAIRSRCTTEFETNHEFVREIIKDIGAYFQEKNAFERGKVQEERKREISQLKDEHAERIEKITLDNLQEKEQIKNNCERLIQKISKENETLRNELGEAKGELQDALIKMERINQSKIDVQKKINIVEEENIWLKQENSKKEDEFHLFKKQITGELKRIKEESERVTKEIIQQLTLKHKKEIESILQTVDDLKFINITRLKEVEGEVLNLEIGSERELLDITEKYQGEKENLQAELKHLYDELQRKEREASGLRKDLNKSREMYKQLQQENQDMFNKFEEKIEGFKETIKNDNAMFLEKKNQAANEIDQLRSQIRELNKELKAKNQEIEGLEYRVKLQKDDLIRFRTQIEERENYERSQTIREKPSQTSQQRSDELDSLLSKPIRTGSYNKSFVNNTSDRKTRFTADEQKADRSEIYVARERDLNHDTSYDNLRKKGAK